MLWGVVQGCGAVALDSTGADISSTIVAVDVTPCKAGAVCPACDITFAAAGLCKPGPYLYLYRYVITHYIRVLACGVHLVRLAPITL